MKLSNRYDTIPDYPVMTQELDSCPDPFWRDIAKGLYYTGARAGEFVGIKAKDVFKDEEKPDFLNVRIYTEKNRRQLFRIVPINVRVEPEALDLFNRHTEGKAPDDLAFPPLGEWSRDSFLRNMRKAFNALYGGVAPHYFRHARLTHMIARFKFSEHELQQYAGWSNTKPSSIYVHLNIGNLQEKMK